MNLKDILAISGEPGLFRFIAQGKNAIIVEHLETKKRSSVYGSAKVSSLEDIAIFTENEDRPLGKVFNLIYEKEKGGPSIDPKSSVNDLKTYFETVLPEYDKNKVYPSDIKKVFQWYNTLQRLNLLIQDEPETSESKSEAETVPSDSKSETEAANAEGKKKKTTSSKTKNK
ncbi:MAG TPA: DUF5606 domain-containing protein [Bacteroidales bacterium]|nr:DUF5606 domain-containing protein [Bacteroidales bacterium]HPT22704.1 DUF5606 domain-containing protein [Bacteroidales bacterium]